MAIAARSFDSGTINLAANKPSSPLLTIDKGIGVIAIEGPIVRKPDIFARVLMGATDALEIGDAIRKASERDDIKAGMPELAFSALASTLEVSSRAAGGLLVGFDEITSAFSQERIHLAEHAFAVLVPLGRALKDQRAFAQTGEMDFFHAGVAQFADLRTKPLEERELESVAGLVGGLDERERDRWRERLEFVGNFHAADFHQHLAHAFIEVVEREQAQRAFGFEVFHHAAVDVVNEGEILLVRSAGGAAQGLFQA
jgi:hypothetical protein